MLTALAPLSMPLAGRLNPAPATSAPPPLTESSRPSLGWRVRQRLKLARDGSYLIPLFARVARRLGLLVGYTELRGRLVRADGSVVDYGLLGRKVVTTAGVTYLAADMAGGANDVNAFKFHGCGTGNTAEATGDTALVTELTTQYATDSTRPTGSQGSSTNVYTTVATVTPDSGGTLAITEHGLFSAASAGTLWDRTVFAAINVVGGSGDAISFSHATTFPAGG